MQMQANRTQKKKKKNPKRRGDIITSRADEKTGRIEFSGDREAFDVTRAIIMTKIVPKLEALFFFYIKKLEAFSPIRGAAN